jgi:hypothetical protein
LATPTVGQLAWVESTEEPGAGVGPVAVRGPKGDAERRGCLFQRYHKWEPRLEVLDQLVVGGDKVTLFAFSKSDVQAVVNPYPELRRKGKEDAARCVPFSFL